MRLPSVCPYTTLGRSGLRISKVALGTANFGTHTPESECFAVMDLALECGINCFDTANTYGRKIRVGLAEEIIGRWFAQGDGRREKVILATKVYAQMGNWPNSGRLSARHIIEQCNASLKRLRVDHLDIYQMHHVDRDSTWPEIYQAMETLTIQGKILYVGSSNFAGWHIAKAMEAARTRHYFGLISEQCHYSLAQRMVELELLPACADYGVGVLVWSPLGGGMLARGRNEDGKGGRRATAEMAARVASHRIQLEAYEALCRKIGYEPTHVALSWVLANPLVAAPIIGPRTVEQLRHCLQATDVHLPPEVLGSLEAIWPGPGIAPEAWAP